MVDAPLAHLIIDVNSRLEAVLLQLLLTEGKPQIVPLSRLHKLRSKALSPMGTRSFHCISCGME